MRLGYATPRINGLGITANPLQTTSDAIDSTLNGFLVGLPSNVEKNQWVTPDQVRQSLVGIAHDMCNNVIPPTPPCDPSVFASKIDSAVAQYSSALSSQQATFASQVAAGLISVPSTYYTQNLYQPGALIPTTPPPVASPSQVQYSSQPSNALDRVTPQTSNVQPVPLGNALTPPQSSAPVSGTNAGTSTGTTDLTSRPGMLSSDVSLGGFNIPVWALLGAAALGIFVMVKGK